MPIQNPLKYNDHYECFDDIIRVSHDRFYDGIIDIRKLQQHSIFNLTVGEILIKFVFRENIDLCEKPIYVYVFEIAYTQLLRNFVNFL